MILDINLEAPMWEEGGGRDSVEPECRLDTDGRECREGWQIGRGSQGQVWRCPWGQQTRADVEGERSERAGVAAVRERVESYLPHPFLLSSCYSNRTVLFLSKSEPPSGLCTPFPLALLGTLTSFPFYWIHLTTFKYSQASLIIKKKKKIAWLPPFSCSQYPLIFYCSHSHHFPTSCLLLLSPFACPSLSFTLLGPGFCTPFSTDDIPAIGTNDHLC